MAMEKRHCFAGEVVVPQVSTCVLHAHQVDCHTYVAYMLPISNTFCLKGYCRSMCRSSYAAFEGSQLLKAQATAIWQLKHLWYA